MDAVSVITSRTSSQQLREYLSSLQETLQKKGIERYPVVVASGAKSNVARNQYTTLPSIRKKYQMNDDIYSPFAARMGKLQTESLVLIVRSKSKRIDCYYYDNGSKLFFPYDLSEQEIANSFPASQNTERRFRKVIQSLNNQGKIN